MCTQWLDILDGKKLLPRSFFGGHWSVFRKAIAFFRILVVSLGNLKVVLDKLLAWSISQKLLWFHSQGSACCFWNYHYWGQPRCPFTFASRFAGPKWVKPWASGLVPRGDLVVARGATRGLLGPIPPWITLRSYDFSICICEKYCSVEQLNFNALLTGQNSSQHPQEHTDSWILKSWSVLQIIHVRTKLGLSWWYISGCCV